MQVQPTNGWDVLGLVVIFSAVLGFFAMTFHFIWKDEE